MIHNGGTLADPDTGAALPFPISIDSWSLTLTTAAASTSTTVTSSANPSVTGSSVTLTATVTNSGSPIGANGTVTFQDGTTTLAANVPLDAEGKAITNVNFASEGNHPITASYSGTASFGPSTGSLTQEVNNPTTLVGARYCNLGLLSLPASSATHHAGVPLPFQDLCDWGGRNGDGHQAIPEWLQPYEPERGKLAPGFP